MAYPEDDDEIDSFAGVPLSDNQRAFLRDYTRHGELALGNQLADRGVDRRLRRLADEGRDMDTFVPEAAAQQAQGLEPYGMTPPSHLAAAQALQRQTPAAPTANAVLGPLPLSAGTAQSPVAMPAAPGSVGPPGVLPPLQSADSGSRPLAPEGGQLPFSMSFNDPTTEQLRTGGEHLQALSTLQRGEGSARTHEMLQVPEAVRPGYRHEAFQNMPTGQQAEGDDRSRIRDATVADALARALGGIGVAVGEGMSGPRGLPDRRALLSQVEGLGGNAARVRADIASEQARKDAGTARNDALAQRGAQERTTLERDSTQRAFQGQQAELDRASRERIAASGQEQRAAGQAATQEGQDRRQERQIQAREDLARLQAELRHRGHGGTMNPEQRTRLVQAAQALGLTPEQAEASLQLGGRRGLERAAAHAQATADTTAGIAQRAQATQDVRDQARGIEDGRVPIMPNAGIFSGNLALANGPEGAHARAALADSRVVFNALATIDRVARNANPADPTLVDQLAGARAALLGTMGQSQHFGVLSDSEKQRILDQIPNPQSARQWALGTGQTILRSNQATAEASLRTALETAGVDPDGVQRGISYARTGAIRPQGRRIRGVAGGPYAGHTATLTANGDVPEGWELVQ